jgi:hypothetical protein
MKPPLFILHKYFRKAVNISINFDNQLFLYAAEISYIISNLVLTTKLQTYEQAVSQEFPDNLLCRCLLLP